MPFGNLLMPEPFLGSLDARDPGVWEARVWSPIHRSQPGSVRLLVQSPCPSEDAPFPSPLLPASARYPAPPTGCHRSVLRISMDLPIPQRGPTYQSPPPLARCVADDSHRYGASEVNRAPWAFPVSTGTHPLSRDHLTLARSRTPTSQRFPPVRLTLRDN